MRKVTWLKVHQSVFVPGLGNMESTFPPKSKQYHMDMQEGLNGVECSAMGQLFVVPYANIINYIVAPEALKAKEAPKAEPKPAPKAETPKPKAA